MKSPADRTALPLAETVAALPPALVASTVRPAILAAAESLPPSSGIGFEARLLGDAAQVDFFLRLQKADRSADILAALPEQGRLDPDTARDPHWQRMFRVAREWGGSIPARTIDQLWLEIDKADFGESYPRCSIAFFDVLNAATTMPDGTAAVLLQIVLPLTLGRPIDRLQRDCIRRVLAAGRPFGELKSIGCALTRPDTAIRLVHNAPRRRLGEFLGAVGLSTPEQKCIGLPEQRCIKDGGKRPPKWGAFFIWIRLGSDCPRAGPSWRAVTGACSH